MLAPPNLLTKLLNFHIQRNVNKDSYEELLWVEFNKSMMIFQIFLPFEVRVFLGGRINNHDNHGLHIVCMQFGV